MIKCTIMGILLINQCSIYAMKLTKPGNDDYVDTLSEIEMREYFSEKLCALYLYHLKKKIITPRFKTTTNNIFNYVALSDKQ